MRRFRRPVPPAALWVSGLLVLIAARAVYLSATHSESETNVEFLVEGDYDVEAVTGGYGLILRRASPNGEGTLERARVRLLGVRAPRGLAEREAAEIAGQSTVMLAQTVGGKSIQVRLDRRRIDRDGVFLAYIMADGVLLNESLLRSGLARLALSEGDSQSVGRQLRKAEAEARQAGRGIWKPTF
jgi:endonuclease YncB( thermonuclease family)